jgi:TonB family protein
MKPLLVHPVFRRTLFIACLAGWPARALLAEPADPAGLNAPWRVVQTQAAIFPPRLLQQGVRNGEARVRVSIDADGKLLDALVVYSTKPEFAEEALRVAKIWRYRAALERGEFIGVVGDIEFQFRIEGTIGVARSAFGPKEEMPGNKDPDVYRAESMKNLDAIPTPTKVVPPSYPENWSDRGIRGTALVEFFIDEEGQVRMPVVALADHPLLGGSALAAVMQWRFEPPLSRGRRVLVRAEQLFTFEPKKK